MADVTTQVIEEPAPPPITREEMAATIAESGFFKPRTEYITIGDEPRDGVAVLDMKAFLSAEDVATLKRYLTLMPRQMLWQFFLQKVYPDLPSFMTVEIPIAFGRPIVRNVDIPVDKLANSPADQVYGTEHFKKSTEDMVWAAFIDLFNEANLEYVNANQIAPWDWEKEKMDAYYVSQSDEALAELNKNIDSYRDVALALDPRAQAIMKAYAELPKIGDVGLEINRQNAVRELLRMKDYASAQAVVDAYRYAEDTIIGEAIKQPIPFDVVTDSGVVVARKSEGV